VNDEHRITCPATSSIDDGNIIQNSSIVLLATHNFICISFNCNNFAAAFKDVLISGTRSRMTLNRANISAKAQKFVRGIFTGGLLSGIRSRNLEDSHMVFCLS